MDHILANEGKQIPDLSSVSASAAPAADASGGEPMDEDDEEMQALQAVYGKTGAAGQAAADADAGAKVSRTLCSSVCCLTSVDVSHAPAGNGCDVI